MNIEIFVAVFSALVAYRFVAPVIDRFNPLTRTKDKLISARGISSAGSEKPQRLA
ncbi:hypothetical protein R6242_16110 [Iodobacter sp. CM08]|uniref:hypothetical protein n=1 Tax=Iodobacter sp. CM08 TaxID=3085902 RepID=UPI002982264C|nr:hypothetical protein [Iodobacter sp. CM08]MDW5418091.1 hypothetical protein [Iodobacter sp. CM08]